jgi:hypothetical protein
MPDDLTAIEKRPGSFRLNLADFGVVYKTTFAKGTISDFQKVSDDPLTVQSMVKVKGDAWGESGYIPLFFCPKKQYWDDPDYQAQDFNQDNLYYEKAWMSFRGDDEVSVFLEEGVPKAVLAFADGVPRIGEDIIKMTSALSTNPYFGQVSLMTEDNTADSYAGGDNGPDGKPLKLVQAGIKFLDTFVSQGFVPTQYDGISILQITGYTQIRPGFFAFHTTSTGTIYYYSYAVIVKHFLVPIGPKLYVIEVYWTGAVLYSIVPVNTSYDSYNTYYESDPGGYMAAFNAENQATYAAELASLQTTWGGMPTTIGQPRGTTSLKAAIVQGAPYTQKLYDDTKESPITPTFAYVSVPTTAEMNVAYPGFVHQMAFSDHLKAHLYAQPTGHKFGPDLAIYSRPHTKAELQTAGMWPWDN